MYIRKIGRISFWAGALTLVALLGAASLQAAELVPQTIRTQHHGVFAGQHVAYTALVEPFDLAGTDGRPALHLVGISYLSEKQAGRPVVFAFNGGPIASSYGVHMGALGPKHVVIADDVKADTSAAKLVDNPDSLLGNADLVFFDPAGTGLSRSKNTAALNGYYSVDADAAEFADFVSAWLERHNRKGAPVYILGESYGTIRAPVAAAMLQKRGIAPAGIVLIGQALNIIEYSQRPANIISYAVSLPTLAALAVSHGKASTNGKPLAAFLDEVYHFAGTEYLPALYLGKSLPMAQRQKIADQLAAYTGIPAEYYLAHDLVITKMKFATELLKDRHEVLAMSDGRYSHAADKKDDPAGVIDRPYLRLTRQYLHQDLKVADSDAYTDFAAMEDDVVWQYSKNATPFDDWPYGKAISALFAANPAFKLMVVGGYYDLQTSFGAARYLVERSDWPADRVRLHFYPGGHMVYSVPASQQALSKDLKDFIAMP